MTGNLQTLIRGLVMLIFVPRSASTGIAVAQIFSVGGAKLPHTDLILSQRAETTGWKGWPNSCSENDKCSSGSANYAEHTYRQHW